MKITANGTPREIAPDTSIEQLLRELQLDAGRVAVEHNRNIITRAAFATTLLGEGDTLEIIQFVGGG